MPGCYRTHEINTFVDGQAKRLIICVKAKSLVVYKVAFLYEVSKD